MSIVRTDTCPGFILGTLFTTTENQFSVPIKTVLPKAEARKRLERGTAAELGALLAAILDRAFKGGL